MGGFLQFCGLFHRQVCHRRFRHCQHRIENGDGALHNFAYHSGRRDCGHCLESVHLVERNPFLFFAHAYRRFCRSCHHAHGFEAIQLSIILKIAAFIFLAPLIGMVVAFGFTLLVLYICRRAHPHTAEVWFKKLQLVSSALFSIGHGLNDSQKVMGIIAAAMIAGHSEGRGNGDKQY